MRRFSVADLVRQAMNRTRSCQRRPNAVHRLAADVTMLESRSLLSAVSFQSGVIKLAGDGVENDTIGVTSPTADTLRIEVGTADTITLGDGALGNVSFVLSAGNTVLEIDTTTIAATKAEF